jgi:hypothetical protein
VTAPASPRGHVRGALLRLAVLAVATEACLALVGGLPGAALGAALLAAAGLWTAHYVGAAEVIDNDFRKSARLARAREPSLHGWATAVEAARDSAAGYDQVLRPQLERLYAVRLAERHGVSLRHDPERAAALIGPQAWPWIDPARPARPAPGPRAPLDRWAQAALGPAPIPEPVLKALIERLEDL